MKIGLGVMVASLLAATAAQAATPANWQFARWGMTPAQLRAAAHGTVTPGDAYDVLKGEYAMGPLKFIVQFDYAPRADDPGNMAEDNLILDGILLNLDTKTETCADVVAYLTQTLGKPARATTVGPQGYTWNQPATGDGIRFTTYEDKTCSVLYAPLGAD